MKILIAGFGSIGRRHFHNLLALGETDILFYRTGHSTLPHAELQGYIVEADLQAALAHQPQAVIIANPTALHLQVAIPALEAGCSLFLEKPVSHSLAGVEQLRQAAQSSGALVLVGYQFRFHPGLQQVKTLLEENAIGQPAALRAHWGEYLPGWHPWEDYRQGYSARPDLGGGVVLTLSHPLDYLRWLLGDIQALWAFTGQLSGLALEVEDTAEIGLRFCSGLLGSLHLDYIQRPPAHWLEITGTQGTLHWDNATGAVRLYRAPLPPSLQGGGRGVGGGGREAVGTDQQASEGHWETFLAPPDYERNELFLEQMRHFLAVARGQAQPACSLEDGLRALELALAVHESQAKAQIINFQNL